MKMERVVCIYQNGKDRNNLFQKFGIENKYDIITKMGFGIELLQCEGDLCKSTSYTACFIYFLAMRNKTLVSRTTSKMTH